MHRIRLTLLALILFTAGVARAGIDNAGTTAGNFLSVGSGASILSMGGATLGSGRDLHAAAWNPAALGYLGETQFSLGHSSLAMEASQEWLAFGGRLSNDATRWAVDALYQSEGGFDGRDALNQSTGSFNVSNMALGLRVARPFGDMVSAGFGVRWVNENLGDAKGSGIGFDAGVQARSGQFGFGLAARNVGGQMKYEEGSYDLPGVFGAGVSWAHPTAGIRLNLDANFPNAYYNDVRMGAEWRWQDRLALRAGYRKELSAPSDEPLSGPSFGFGVGAGGMWLDYGFLVGGADVQGQHRVGLTFRPNLSHSSRPSMSPRVDNTPAQTPEPVAVAKPVAPSPKPQAVATTPAPVVAAAITPSEPKAEPLQITLSDDASSAPSTRRRSEPSAEALATSKPVKAPKRVIPKVELEPVVSVEPVASVEPVESKPAKAAKPPKPAKAPKPAKVPPVAVMTDEVASATLTPAPSVQPVATRAPQVEVVKPTPTKAPEVVAPKPAQRPTMIVVKAGETLAALAKLYDNSVPALMMENNLVSDQVKPGQKIKLPPAGRR